MSDAATVSIIVCTRNRAEHLRGTLAALARLCIPEEVEAELIVVDNASTDETAQIVQQCRLPNMSVQYLYEPEPGQCRAYNAAVAVARGEVLLFTDDDVRPPRDWVRRMIEPICSGTADAVAGAVEMAAHLHRPWLEPQHRDWLACTEKAAPSEARGVFLVGANMAISRRVFERVPRFDPEMGPGAIGHASDTLFSIQLEKAGYHIATAYDVIVEHHFEENRLTREAFVRQARKRGEFNAYVAHHWFHADWRLPHLKVALHWLRLQSARLAHWHEWRVHPAAPTWELPLLESYFTFLCYLGERKRPRNYAEQGLVKAPR